MTVPPEVAELAADVWWRCGAAAVEELDDGGLVQLIAGFADPADARRATGLATEEGHGPVSELPVDDDGLDGWRAWAEPVAAGPWWVVPAWLDPPESASPDAVLRIEPGRTFGSGSHPTTRLVLEVLCVGDGHLLGTNPEHRRVELVQRPLGEDRRDLTGERVRRA